MSWAIRKATNFDASHASVHLMGRGIFSQNRLVFESTTHGIGLTHPAIWDKANQPVAAFRLQRANLEAGETALREMWQYLGGDYDYEGLLHFGFRLLAQRIFGARVEAPDTPGVMFCSELAARWINATKVQLGRRPGLLRPDDVSPAGLFRELEQSELFVRAPCEHSLSAIFT